MLFSFAYCRYSIDLGRQRVQPGQLLQHVGVGARAGLGLLQHGQLQLLETAPLASWLGRGDVQWAACQLVDLLLQRLHSLAVLLAQPLEAARHRRGCRCTPVRPAPRPAAFPVHANKPSSCRRCSFAARIGRKPQRQHRRPRQRTSVTCATGTSSIRFWFLPVPISSLILIVVVVQVPPGQLVQVVVPLARHPAGSWPPSCRRRRRQVRRPPPQHDHVVLQVLPDLLDRRVFQHGPQRLERLDRIQAWFARRGRTGT